MFLEVLRISKKRLGGVADLKFFIKVRSRAHGLGRTAIGYRVRCLKAGKKKMGKKERENT